MVSAVNAIASLLVLVALSDYTDIPPFASGKVEQQQWKRQKQPEAYQERLVEWLLEDPNGFFHPSILWKRLGPDEKSGPYAFHVTDDVPKGTPLIVLPRKYVLESHMDNTNDEPVEDYRMCVTVEKMISEYNEHADESFYAPYLSYLFEENAGGTMRGLMPTTWSDHSKEILGLILEMDENGWNSLHPLSIEYDSIFSICLVGNEEPGSKGVENPGYKDGDDKNHSKDDYSEEIHSDEDYYEEDYYDEDYFEGIMDKEQVQDAYLFLVSRGWYDKLLPILDMFNHRNGPGRNVEITSINDKEDSDVAAYAWRDISKGEQLQITYSECMDDTCGFGANRYSCSTQFIFGEYGFVESYPRQWNIDNGLEEDDEEYQDLTIEVTIDANDDAKMVVKWIYDTPNEKSIECIQKHLARLKSIESRVREGVGELETVLLGEGNGPTTTIHNIDHERDTILEYYEAYIQVFELALEHKDDPVAVTEKSFRLELRELWKSEGRGKTIDEIRKHELLQSTRLSHEEEPIEGMSAEL
jgi:hypothetical protein